MTETSRRFLLRERTAPAHRRVDDAVGGFDSLASYERYVVGLYEFRRPIEQALSRTDWPMVLNGWRPTFVAGDIKADLDVLGLRPARTGVDCDVPENMSSLFGCLYVLEGSGFGAKVLLKRAQALGLDDGTGASHLAAQASSRGWAPFITALETAPDLDIDAAVQAALDTFAVAEKAFADHEYA